jgi:hypothetical protein
MNYKKLIFLMAAACVSTNMLCVKNKKIEVVDEDEPVFIHEDFERDQTVQRLTRIGLNKYLAVKVVDFYGSQNARNYFLLRRLPSEKLKEVIKDYHDRKNNKINK